MLLSKCQKSFEWAPIGFDQFRNTSGGAYLKYMTEAPCLPQSPMIIVLSVHRKILGNIQIVEAANERRTSIIDHVQWVYIMFTIFPLACEETL